MATFFNPPQQGEPLAQAELVQIISINPTFTDKEGRGVVQIDDMLFIIDDLMISGFSGRRWPGGNVYYTFANNVSQENKNRFTEACAEWSSVAQITFIARTDQPNYIVVESSDTENSSYVGMTNGPQPLKIKNWAWKFIIAHEIGHALGLAHEHQRTDRDTYVRINWTNIEAGKEHNFVAHPTTHYTPYDFASILHYRKDAFSRNAQPTINALPPHEAQEMHMGNRNYMTPFDAAGMASHYGPRHAGDDKYSGVRAHLGLIDVPDDTTTIADWAIIVSPLDMGAIESNQDGQHNEGDSDGDNAILKIECEVRPAGPKAWMVWARCLFRVWLGHPVEGFWMPGKAGFLIVRK